MTAFCLMWVPLFYLLRRSFTPSVNSGIWALILGSFTAIIQFFLGYLTSPGAFDYSRFVFGFIDIVSLPVLIPLVIYFFILIFKRFQGDIDFGNFALLWLIPVGALRALSWSSTHDPILLVMTPLLWTALAAGISFFINLTMNNFRWYTLILSAICILILPVLGSAAYWAFFSQRELFGFALLAAAFIPAALSFFVGKKA